MKERGIRLAASLGWRNVFLLILFASTTVADTEIGDEATADFAPSNQVARDRERQFAELAHSATALEQQFSLFKRIVKLARPSVVHIEAKKWYRSDTSGRRRSLEETGSGVIVRIRGEHFVLTNVHVVQDAKIEQILIKLFDGRKLHPTRVLSDPDTDVAVLEIEATSLLPARLGNSSSTEIGDFVLAFGSPFGLSHSVTFGIISAKARRGLELDSTRSGKIGIQNFLQTDAAINPGNSGGPLLNLRGEVIGLNTAIASNSGGNDGIGFSIPINSAMVVAEQLTTTGSVARAYLGVNLDTEFNSSEAASLGLQRMRGARVLSVTKDSPASTANIRPDDVILRYDDMIVEDSSHLINMVKLTSVGKNVSVDVIREGSEITINVVVGDRSQFHKSN